MLSEEVAISVSTINELSEQRTGIDLESTLIKASQMCCSKWYVFLKAPSIKAKHDVKSNSVNMK